MTPTPPSPSVREVAEKLTEAQRSVVLRMPFAELRKGWSSTYWPTDDHIAGQQLCRIGVFKDAGCWNWFWTPLGLAVRQALPSLTEPAQANQENESE